jgi:hypothetical protein
MLPVNWLIQPYVTVKRESKSKSGNIKQQANIKGGTYHGASFLSFKPLNDLAGIPNPPCILLLNVLQIQVPVAKRRALQIFSGECETSVVLLKHEYSPSQEQVFFRFVLLLDFSL